MTGRGPKDSNAATAACLSTCQTTPAGLTHTARRQPLCELDDRARHEGTVLEGALFPPRASQSRPGILRPRGHCRPALCPAAARPRCAFLRRDPRCRLPVRRLATLDARRGRHGGGVQIYTAFGQAGSFREIGPRQARVVHHQRPPPPLPAAGRTGLLSLRGLGIVRGCLTPSSCSPLLLHRVPKEVLHRL